MLAGWFLTLGLERKRKHRFSGTLPKIGTGVQSAACHTKLITVTLHPHQGLTAPTQRGGKTSSPLQGKPVNRKQSTEQATFLLAMLYPSIPATGLHRETLLCDTELEYQGEVHGHLLSSHTNHKPLSWSCSELSYWNYRIVWVGRDSEGSSSLKFCGTCHTNMCIYCPFCLFCPHFCLYSALKKGRKVKK